MKKLLSLLLVCTLLASITGCSNSNKIKESSKEDSSEETSSKTEDQKKQDLIITESGYILDGKYMYYVYGINNPNELYDVSLPSCTITAYAEDGSIIGTTDNTLFTLPHKQTIYETGFLDCKGLTPAKVEFTPNCDEDDFKTMGIVTTYKLSVSNISEIPNSFGTSYTGVVENQSPQDSGTVKVVVIFRNAGAIVGGDFTFIDNVASQKTAPFEITVYQDYTYDSYEIYAYDWSY